MSEPVNSLFFDTDETAREVGLRPIEVLWSFAKGSIKGQRIKTANRYVESIRFTSDQIVQAVQLGKIYTDQETRPSFRGDEDAPWPVWFNCRASKQDFQRSIAYAANNKFSDSEMESLFVEKNKHLVTNASNGAFDFEKAFAERTLEIDRDRLDTVSSGRELVTPYERTIADAICDQLKRAFNDVPYRKYYNSPSSGGFFGIENPLIWVCSQIAEGKTALNLIGNVEDVYQLLNRFALDWTEQKKVRKMYDDVTVQYTVPITRMIPVEDIRKVAAKLF